MKFNTTITLLGLFLLGACEDTVQKGDKLTAAERAYLRQRAAAKCVAASNESFEELEEDSNSNMLGFERNQTWKYETKKDGNLFETSYLYVWKVAAPNVYFRLNVTVEGVTSNKFIKLDTSSNVDMFRAIQYKGCDKTFEVTGSTSKNANIDVARTRVDTETLTESETDYRFVSNYPAFFGNLNKLMTKRTLNNDEVVTKTEKYDYVISTNAATVQPLTYTDATIANKSYCMVKFTAPVAPSTYDTYAFPFETDCATSDTDPTKPDANADALSDFNPVVELAGPY